MKKTKSSYGRWEGTPVKWVKKPSKVRVKKTKKG